MRGFGGRNIPLAAKRWISISSGCGKRQGGKTAFVADKVVGKGAAALMILGSVEEVYTDVASTAALELFARHGVEVECALEVPQIVNRARTGRCPVETLCLDCRTAEECLEPIRNFIRNNS